MMAIGCVALTGLEHLLEASRHAIGQHLLADGDELVGHLRRKQVARPMVQDLVRRQADELAGRLVDQPVAMPVLSRAKIRSSGARPPRQQFV